jgi:site-specific DNA recombinase
LCQLIRQPDYIADALQRAHCGEWLPQHLQSRKQSLRKALSGVTQQLERLTEAYLLAIIPLAEYRRRREELERKNQALEAETKELEAQVDRQAELAQLSTSIEEFCNRIHAGLANATFEQKRALVELLIDRFLWPTVKSRSVTWFPPIRGAKKFGFVICVKTISITLFK